MKIWQKVLLSILTILYVIPLINFIWPQIFYYSLGEFNSWLAAINIPQINWLLVIEIFGYGLLIGLGVILCVILFAPVTRLEVILVDTKDGRLELSKQSLTSYVELVAREMGLSVSRVKVKPTRSHVKVTLHAVTHQTDNLKPNIEQMRQEITRKVGTYIGAENMHVSTKLLFDQRPAEKRKKARVV